ncbi:hypothetical protein A2U01_0059110, partial [Trifolium medium]|nr:hypothetical protein [Trifolium medium]
KNATPQHLIRRYSVKRWSKFKPELLSPARLEAWFKAHPNMCKVPVPVPNDFLVIRPKILDSLKDITDPQEFFDKMRETMTALSDQDIVASTSANDADLDNEDDYYGIEKM